MSLICGNISCPTSVSWSASWWMPGAEPCVVVGTTVYASLSRPGTAARPHGWRADWWRGTVWPPCRQWLRARAWPAGSSRWGRLEPSSSGKATRVEQWKERVPWKLVDVQEDGRKCLKYQKSAGRFIVSGSFEKCVCWFLHFFIFYMFLLLRFECAMPITFEIKWKIRI